MESKTAVDTRHRTPRTHPHSQAVAEYRPCVPGEHCHESYRIMLVLAGSGTLHVDSTREDLQPGDVLAIPPGSAHWLDGPDPSPRVLGFEFFPGSLLEPTEFPVLQTVFSDPVAHCQGAVAGEIERLLRKVRGEQRHPGRSGLLALRAYTLTLLVEIDRHKARAANRPRAEIEAERQMAAVRAMIESRLTEPLPLTELATSAHTSPRQLTALFKRAYGLTPLQYQTRLRIATAQEMLCHTGTSVQEIAHSVGYENLSHFYRLFEHHAGMPPGRFRQAAGSQG